MLPRVLLQFRLLLVSFGLFKRVTEHKIPSWSMPGIIFGSEASFRTLIFRPAISLLHATLILSASSCGRHPAKPRTVTKRLTKTKLITRTATATGTAAKGRRHELADREADVIAEEPKLFDDNNEAVEISERPVSALFARHLCPTCPKGVTVLNKSKGKNNGGSGAIYCCPQPVTKTVSRIVKTLTKTVMKTVTAKKQFVSVGDLGLIRSRAREINLLTLLPAV